MALQDLFATIVCPIWLGVLRDRFPLDINEPHFRNPRLGVARNFLLAIILQRRLGDFHHDEHVRRQGMRPGIKILTDTQYRDVWLGFCIVGELNWILDAHNGQASNLAAYEGIQPFDNRGMPGTDGTHGTYLAVYQLDTVIFGEDTCLCHPCEVSNGKLPAENLDNHTFSQYKRMITP